MRTQAWIAGAAGLGLALVARACRTGGRYTFEGKTVVITGGSRGLGLVMARQFADEGAMLLLVARTGDDLARAADDVRTHHATANVHTLVADVRHPADAERIADAAVERTGRLDVLVNNAGIIQMGPLAHMTPADFDDALRTHFWGPLHIIRAALPHLRRQGGARIVNISSIGGRVAVPHLLPYCASKFALAGLSDGLRAELAADGIRVTTVCPGLMRTGSPVNALFKGQREREYAWFTIGGSMPLATIDASRAARQIVEACRRGDAELVITLPARLAIAARALAPEMVATAFELVHRMLPGPAGPDGDASERGREHESRLAGPSSPLTASTYAAAARNNEL
jgi:NAD(P)-dependent dehydrogenase (short-subunit alcohol dehydrogenase family)